MLPQEVIRIKRTGSKLSSAHIADFFGGYLEGRVADYQVSAMLMAILLKGMDPEETAALTLFMRDSGTVMSWDGPRDQIVDKHSTGGVGDKTSLILMPLCVLEGLQVPMIAGRGLGHTGGTLDKLASIPGMNVFLSSTQAKKMMTNHGGAFMGQTGEIAPVDKRLYAMRDVTDTVESIPLITASILSKKLAEGIGGLVMDVKFGSGAFMEKKSDALALAQSIASVGRAAGVNVRCALTDMGSPLGDRAGNALEIEECVEVLHGGGPASTRDLSLDLALEMIALAKPKVDRPAMRATLEGHLKSGRAFDVFTRIIRDQGGDIRVLEDPQKLAKAMIERPVLATTSGVIAECDVRALGLAVIELGGGRRQTDDTIDPAVGLSKLKRVGDKVVAGEPVAIIHGNSDTTVKTATERLKDAYKIQDQAAPEPLIWQIL